MQRSVRLWLMAPTILLLGATTTLPLSALQLGGRPAEEWALTLENGQRLGRLEIDAGFLPIIQKRAQEAGVYNVYPVLGEFADPKLPRRDVDFALIHDVLHHVEERAAFVMALASYMAPDSRIVVVDYDMNLDNVSHADEPEMLISPEQVAGWMEAAGFEVSRSWDLFENKFVIEYSKVD